MSEFQAILAPMPYISNQEMMPLYDGLELSRHPSYPPRSIRFPISWGVLLDDYQPVEYESPRLAEPRPIWAEPKDKQFNKDEVSLAFDVIEYDELGRPLNPIGRTGITGRGKLGKWGPNIAVDGVVTRSGPSSATEVLLIKRDTNQWAFPGGFYDEGEFVDETCREVSEETGLVLPRDSAQLACNGLYIFSSRMTDNVWIESVVYGWELEGEPAEQIPQAGDDALGAGWFEIDDGTLNSMVPTHAKLLRKLHPS